MFGVALLAADVRDIKNNIIHTTITPIIKVWRFILYVYTTAYNKELKILYIRFNSIFIFFKIIVIGMNQLILKIIDQNNIVLVKKK